MTSDSYASTPTYVPSEMIHVYVQSSIDGKVVQWNAAQDGIFTDNRIENGTQIYTQNDEIFSIRLNENKTYELMFGNGFNGKIPDQNSLIYVFYLDSNGKDGQISTGDVVNAKLQHNASSFGINEELYKKIFDGEMSYGDSSSDITKTTSYLLSESIWQNNHNSSDSAEEETVDEIRHNAP